MPAPVVIFGSDRPVTCAVMDYSRRLMAAINGKRPGFVEMRPLDADKPAAFVGEIVSVLKAGATAHLQFPVEGWGNSVVPGSALFAARALTRKGRIVATMHEWTSLNRLRYLSMIPDLLAIDDYVFVSPAQRETFQTTPWVSRAKRQRAPVIPIGPNIMPKAVDPAITARERTKIIGAGAMQAELVIGFFGVLYASKRPDLLLRVIRALHDKGVKARLLVCGDFLWDKPHDREAFFALARELAVFDWLDFRGRIEDEGELIATLAAADVFLLPYTDGISARRSSFQAVAPLAIPIVSTDPERADEFAMSDLLKRKVFNPATVLRPVDAAPEVFAEAVLDARGQSAHAVGVNLAALWDEAAAAHLALYDRMSPA